MGLLQQAIITYDEMKHKVGVEYEGKVTLAPIGYINVKADIVISIDIEGNFINSESFGKDGKNVIIPVTEKSSARTSGIEPHPLCDKIAYLIGDEKHIEKYSKFVEELKKWCDSKYKNKKVDAIYRYLKKNTVFDDLLKSNIIKKDDKGNAKYGDNLFVVWNVVGDSNGVTEIWKDNEVIKSFYSYYYETISKTYKKGICYISGKNEILATQNLKGIVNLHGNAKIISANDTTNFTYRGRFINDEEAMGISYISSQKAHNALKWLILNQGVYFGKRTFLCWNPNGIELPKANSCLIPFSSEDVTVYKNETEYKKIIKKIINSYKCKFIDDSKAIMVVFDAATKGRLGILYYNELLGSDFLDRLEKWDTTCCWIDNRYGVYSPSLNNIVEYAFGTRREKNGEEKVEADPKVRADQMHRILLCKLGGSHISFGVVKALISNSNNIQIYDSTNRAKLLFITCAVLRKYKIDVLKEECSMALEEEKKDRSYQYGRLLAVLEKAERDTYDKDMDKKRETNAIRMQSVFIKRPMYACNIIINQVKNSYYPKLEIGSRVKYEKIIGDIFSILSEFSDEEKAKPLNENYLFGYYLQKNELYKKTKNEEVEMEEE